MGNDELKNEMAEVKETGTIGLGVFAIRDIKKGEVIADFVSGVPYHAEKTSDLPKEIGDYALQISEHTWLDTKSIGHYLNHSCEPNCGIKGNTKIVAMRDIKKGEQITFDYEVSEDSDWNMECKCGSPSCRKRIGGYRNLALNIRQKYKGYISDWLIKKYQKTNDL